MAQLKLKLYIAGESVRSESALSNLRDLMESQDNLHYDLQVIDVMQDPASAEADFVLATPTLVKLEPLPVRRIIGDLSDQETLIKGLDLRLLLTESLEGNQ